MTTQTTTEAGVASRTVGGLLGLYAQTALHPGSGTALGTVDLPVQRERHTHWPTVAGSALKGILRDACRERIAVRTDLDQLERFDDRAAEDDRPAQRAERKGRPRERADATLVLNELFGPPTAGSSEFAGALSVTDARLLAFPVRSLKGVFAWATCPAVLDRLKRDAHLVRIPLWPSGTIPEVAENQAVVSSKGSACLVGGSLVLEEFDFTRAERGDAWDIADWIRKALLPTAPAYAGAVERFPKHLVILNDNDFTHFARHATEVMARVGLDYQTKTVRSGALFYQEFLPAETLLYTVLLASPARARLATRDAALLWKTLIELLPPVLQIGGDETTGKGFCAVRLFGVEGGK
jgi:CRISPR-associated protein Cmr4